MATVYLGLGSNLGDRLENIQSAMTLLEADGVNILKKSTILETDPVGTVPQGKFLNAVIKVRTQLSPEMLLSLCQSIEKELGRVRGVPNGPRPIDLDILLYARITMDTPQLKIPHPRMFERDFVMNPLNEIEPDLWKEFPHAGHQVC